MNHGSYMYIALEWPLFPAEWWIIALCSGCFTLLSGGSYIVALCSGCFTLLSGGSYIVALCSGCFTLLSGGS